MILYWSIEEPSARYEGLALIEHSISVYCFATWELVIELGNLKRSCCIH